MGETMPRKLAGDVDVIEAAEEGTVEVSEKPKKAAIGSTLIKRLWDGDPKSLPESTKDKKGTHQKNGESRYMLHRGVGRYELQAVYRSRGGIKTRLVRMLIDSPKRPRDRQLIVALKKAGAHID